MRFPAWALAAALGATALPLAGARADASSKQPGSGVAATATDPYPFVASEEVAAQLAAQAGQKLDNLETRVPPPPGTERVPLAAASFGSWLRRLPLYAPGHPVYLYNGQLKARQDVHAAVVAMDVGKRDLQQCADTVMRLRAEYLLAQGLPQLIRFHPDPGQPTTLAYSGHSRADFNKYLTRVFSDAGSASLQAELEPVRGPVQPGDVLIQGGHPGHAVQVLDVASGGGKRYLLLGQSYMPAQQLHVLHNLSGAARASAAGSWFDEADLDSAHGLQTPEWRPFRRADVRRFPRLARPGLAPGIE